MVEAAGQGLSGSSRINQARTFFGPKCLNRRLTATIAAISAAGVLCGQLCGACDRSRNQSTTPLSRRRLQS